MSHTGWTVQQSREWAAIKWHEMMLAKGGGERGYPAHHLPEIRQIGVEGGLFRVRPHPYCKGAVLIEAL